MHIRNFILGKSSSLLHFKVPDLSSFNDDVIEESCSNLLIQSTDDTNSKASTQFLEANQCNISPAGSHFVIEESCSKFFIQSTVYTSSMASTQLLEANQCNISLAGSHFVIE